MSKPLFSRAFTEKSRQTNFQTGRARRNKLSDRTYARQVYRTTMSRIRVLIYTRVRVQPIVHIRTRIIRDRLLAVRVCVSRDRSRSRERDLKVRAGEKGPKCPKTLPGHLQPLSLNSCGTAAASIFHISDNI